MPLEVATYINGLDSANPAATDAKSQGDDHLRLIKSTVKTTFPNVAGAVTATHTQLSYVTGVTSAIQTQLNAKADVNGNVLTATRGQGSEFANTSSPAEGKLIVKTDGQNDAYLLNNATRWGLFSTSGGLALEYNRASGKFVFFGKAATLGSGGAGGTEMTFSFIGQSGQPTWVWGSNTGDGSSCLVWNPANFNVNYAVTSGASNTSIGNGQTWQNLTGSRSAGTTYTNSTGRTITVCVEVTSTGGPQSFGVSPTVGGVTFPATTAYSTNAGYRATAYFHVPSGQTYSVGVTSSNMSTWAELR